MWSAGTTPARFSPRASRRFWLARAADFGGDSGTRTVPAGHVVGWFLASRARILDPWLRAGKGTRVLDAGCGRGYLSGTMARRGARVTCLDISGSALALARRTLAETGTGGHVLVRGSVTGRALPRGPFDLVLASGLLDYLPDHRRALAILASRTRRGGTLVFTVPKRPSPFFLLRSGAGLWLRRRLLGLPPMMSSLTRAEVREAVLSAGLEIRELRSCWGTMWAVHCSRK